jgi:hypothetical protein
MRHRVGLYDDTITSKSKTPKAKGNPVLLELEFGLELEEGVVYILLIQNHKLVFNNKN